LVDLAEDDDARKFGMRVAGDGGMEDEDALRELSVVVRGREGCWRTHLPLAICFGGHILVRFLDKHLEFCGGDLSVNEDA
jgi:hypothetical protein